MAGGKYYVLSKIKKEEQNTMNLLKTEQSRCHFVTWVWSPFWKLDNTRKWQREGYLSVSLNIQGITHFDNWKIQQSDKGESFWSANLNIL